MTCDECHVWRRCPHCGASPVTTEKARVECVEVAETKRGLLVSVPVVQAVNVESGKVVSVQTRLVLFRRTWWRRLLRMP